MPTTITARLDRARIRLLCDRLNDQGRQTCGGELADIEWPEGWSADPSAGDAAVTVGPSLGRIGRPFVKARPGWGRDDGGVWTEGSHVRSRRDRKAWASTGNPHAVLTLSPPNDKG